MRLPFGGMPLSPVHHAMVGFLLAQGRCPSARREVAVVACALAPDLDTLVPGLHHSFGHSLWVGPILIVLLGLVLRSAALDLVRCQAAYVSHLSLDFIAISDRVFWPFSWLWPWGQPTPGFATTGGALVRDRFPLLFTALLVVACALALVRRLSGRGAHAPSRETGDLG